MVRFAKCVNLRGRDAALRQQVHDCGAGIVSQVLGRHLYQKFVAAQIGELFGEKFFWIHGGPLRG